ncbi:hypothetical protein QBC45DRAFT_34258 [Copromyces sp. CBS 386.78]|nr:hypothetical protein QBC45DRAFT_34258 [Copromyces sp. CBS 386.78]
MVYVKQVIWQKAVQLFVFALLFYNAANSSAIYAMPSYPNKTKASLDATGKDKNSQMIRLVRATSIPKRTRKEKKTTEEQLPAAPM